METFADLYAQVLLAAAIVLCAAVLVVRNEPSWRGRRGTVHVVSRAD